MTHLGSLAEDDADALDVARAMGVADGGNAVVSGNGGNGRRHEQLDELEDLVATVGLHKAVACLRSALGTVAGDEIPPLVARDGGDASRRPRVARVRAQRINSFFSSLATSA